ncbi:MAG TPA: TadE/TadG family type IV pilus assembly protein [Chloroflexota bacterium]|nr:TadE/TadG family type IV pilus assembly protein [Chloroflexota bacterium]
MVEYALIVVPFFLLLFGVFDLSRAVFYQHLLTSSAREAARYGVAAQRTPTSICQAAVRATAASLPGAPASFDCTSAASGPVTSGGLTVTVSRDPVGATDRYVRVQLQYVFQPLTPLIASVVGGVVPLGASSAMYVEQE